MGYWMINGLLDDQWVTILLLMLEYDLYIRIQGIERYGGMLYIPLSYDTSPYIRIRAYDTR